MFIIPCPTTLFIVWIFIPVCHSQTESLFDLDADLFDEASIEWMIAPHESGAEESYSLEQMIEPDASEFLAQNMDCGNDVDILRSFGKKLRRQSLCPVPLTEPPVGQTQPPSSSNSDHDEEFNFRAFLRGRPLTGSFNDDLAVCPPEIFRSSITPVCEERYYTVVYSNPGQSHATLYNVFPCRSTHLPFNRSH